MIRHVFKLVWNRKRSTGLILAEILICFLVLCGVLASSCYVGMQWSKPLGFDYENVWSVEVSGIGGVTAAARSSRKRTVKEWPTCSEWSRLCPKSRAPRYPRIHRTAVAAGATAPRCRAESP